MRPLFLALSLSLLASTTPEQQAQQASAPVSLTIYNQDFAVARTTVDLNLKQGTSAVTSTQVTSELEPDSVVLRDPAGKHVFTVVEQNYDAAVVNQDWLLQKYEGQTIDFQTPFYIVDEKTNAHTPIMERGRILRASPPLIEVDGKMQFQLPGTPHFPAFTGGLLLKPTLRWQIASDHVASFPAELSYITRGFTWSATYNLVAGADTGGTVAAEPMDLVGWITMQNNSGVDFPSARIQLMAGDVAKIQPSQAAPYVLRSVAQNVSVNGGVGVTQQNFDDFHLYDLNRSTSLGNGETKQVEFLNANAVQVTRHYEYDGSPSFLRYSGGGYGGGILDSSYGLQDGQHVLVVNQFVNSTANHLAIPLPAGRLRLYRRDKNGAMQFAGETEIRHTPRNETVRFVTGGAFDITGKRTQTDFKVDTSRRTIDESFSIELKNQKDEAIDLTVIDHLYRAANWEITSKSADYRKSDSSTIEFPVTLKPDSATTVSYTVHYSW